MIAPPSDLPFTIEDPEPLPAGWPDAPEPEVWHGLAGAIARTLAPYTEADPVAILVTALVFLGHVMGRTPHLVADGARHGLNEFLVLVGDSGNSRKGTSFARVRELFSEADTD